MTPPAATAGGAAFAGGASLRQWLAVPRASRRAALTASLERIRALDRPVHAWVRIHLQDAVADGPLADIPFGAKDIIETRGLATEYGSPIYRGRVGGDDAAIVRYLRERGAVLLGKTHTTAFAYRTPGPTRNPHNLEHTPGGSSSGSAAAVAAGMVPLAIGTQTQGSILRPASFCGIAGFKPTYGLLPMDGVLPLAPSLDTLGFFAESAADMLALWEALGHSVPAGERGFAVGVPPAPLDVETPMRVAFEAAVTRLREEGIPVIAVEIADMLGRLNAASRTVMACEAARVHADRYREHGAALAHLADLVRDGQQVTAAAYAEALRCIAEYREAVTALFARVSAILVPAAAGPAPVGLASTGDPRLNAPWTALGTPAISIPMPAAGGLPLGLQVVARPGDDGRLLRGAERIARILEAR